MKKTTAPTVKTAPLTAAPSEAGKTASVEIDGTTYKLAYSFNAIASVEPSSGCNLLAGMMNMAELSGLQLRGLLCAAIIAADPTSKMTVEKAGTLIKYETIYSITEALAESMLLSMKQHAA